MFVGVRGSLTGNLWPCRKLVRGLVLLPLISAWTKDPTMQNRKTRFPTAPVASLAVIVTALLGGVLGHLLGTPKTFLVIVTAMVVWLISGWFFGGWRTVLVGISALSAALSAAEGTYAVSAIFFCTAFLLLFADISPRERQHNDGVRSKI